MKIINLLALSFLPRSLAFVAAPTKARITSLLHSTDDDVREQDTSNISRRNMLWKAGAVASLSFVTPFAALADDVAESSSGSAKIAKVVVAGATGQTGSRIYSKLLSDATRRDCNIKHWIEYGSKKNFALSEPWGAICVQIRNSYQLKSGTTDI